MHLHSHMKVERTSLGLTSGEREDQIHVIPPLLKDLVDKVMHKLETETSRAKFIDALYNWSLEKVDDVPYYPNTISFDFRV